MGRSSTNLLNLKYFSISHLFSEVKKSEVPLKSSDSDNVSAIAKKINMTDSDADVFRIEEGSWYSTPPRSQNESAQ